MAILSDIDKIESETFGGALLGIILLVTPGFLAIYNFQKDAFLELEFFKLLFLAISLIAPFFIINTLATVRAADTRGKGELFSSMLVASMMSGLIFYIALAVSYFGALDLKIFIAILIILEILTFIASLFVKGK